MPLEPALGVSDFGHFVNGPRSGESQPFVELHRAGILRRDFQKSLSQARILKSLQCHLHQGGAKPETTVVGHNAQILNGAHTAAINDALHRATIMYAALLVRKRNTCFSIVR